MKLDYIYHSGFAIEADGITVIIDYYKDSSEEAPDRGIVHGSVDDPLRCYRDRLEIHGAS